ncbi:hypothetical protein [Bacteroides eggerthii]|uniref:hypothetical protein n=1 Tax=Bacteroides eggerthii TaxID=28111 RepID=UPI00189C74C3|nr:hypothetical protein [Bacteroides eggerthii]
MEQTKEVKKERIKALITGKQLYSIISVVDCRFDEATGKETRLELDRNKYYDPGNNGEFEIEIIYNKKQARK